jgi:hypothetical protein
METENIYMKKELTRLQEMMAESEGLGKVDVLTFKHKTPAMGPNDFDDELEKGLQARVLFQREEWREELKKEMNAEMLSLKNVGGYVYIG